MKRRSSLPAARDQHRAARRAELLFDALERALPLFGGNHVERQRKTRRAVPHAERLQCVGGGRPIDRGHALPAPYQIRYDLCPERARGAGNDRHEFGHGHGKNGYSVPAR